MLTTINVAQVMIRPTSPSVQQITSFIQIADKFQDSFH